MQLQSADELSHYAWRLQAMSREDEAYTLVIFQHIFTLTFQLFWYEEQLFACRLSNFLSCPSRVACT
jgi:hypothetical protein